VFVIVCVNLLKKYTLMTFSKLASLLFFSIIFISCSSDSNEDTPATPQQQFEGDFFPLNVDNSWDYNVVNTDNNTAQNTTSEDELYVESETTNGYSLSVNQGGLANGTMSGILTSGELTRTETTLAANGTVGLPIDGFDFQINLENALLYNTQADNGAQLSIKSGSFTQDFQGYPVTINYTLKSTQLQNLSSFDVNGTTYNSVTSSNISLELSVTTEVTILVTQTISILDPQQVLSVNSYYAENVGLIKAEANTNYQLNTETAALLNQLGADLGALQTSLSLTNTQVLTDYNVIE